MEFKSGERDWIKNPSEYEVISGLKDLKNSSEDFAILARGKMTYIQTAGTPEEGYVIEYQIDDIDNHHKTVEENLSEEDVIAAFVSYYRGNNEWKDNHTWEKEDLNTGCNTKTIVYTIIIIAIIVFYIVTL